MRAIFWCPARPALRLVTLACAALGGCTDDEPTSRPPLQDASVTPAVDGEAHDATLDGGAEARDGGVATPTDARESGPSDSADGETSEVTALPCTPTPARPCVVELALGEAHTCARLSDGTLRCWGRYGAGQLGIGDLPDAGPATNVRVPTPVVGLDGVARVAAGAQHTCAATADGSISCWGTNTFGRLGNGTTEAARAPSRVALPSPALPTAAPVMALGRDHTCAVLTTGVSCWGSNANGQLGTGDARDGGATVSLLPAPVAIVLRDVVELALGGQHTCARRAGGTVACWGDNSAGQLGAEDGFLTARRGVPADVPGLTGAVAIAAGFAHTCALNAGGVVRCWGDNSARQLGIDLDADGGIPRRTDIPTVVPNLPPDVVQIAVGARFTCARRRGGAVLCWGQNAEYQLGDTGGTASTPIEVEGVDGAVELRAGASHACARLADSSVVCWGSNASGQLGAVAELDGGESTKVATPTAIAW